ncbi:MAG: sodium:calcium antiporter [Nitrospiraceae bacterium]|jgi:cation:H+ antiporter|nr:sodium:calcium antiporter [Nitrospiraceae bacterium]
MNPVDIVALLGGVIILIFAAKYLVEGLIGTASRLAVPPFILAMLIISIDLEEFAPAVIGSYQHLTALSYGSILGTVIFLILLALGSAAALFPIRHPDFPVKYIWLLGGAIALVFGLSLDGEVSRTDGIITLAAYLAFMVYLVRDMRRTRAAKEEIEEAEGAVAGIVKAPSWRFPLMLVAGLVGLVVGALLVIKGTKAVLHWSGIEETILGLTLLAIAANSVELVEAIIPAKQGHPEVVIGNVAGSSFFQLLFTLGICALINPLQVNQTAITYFFPAVAMSWLILLILVWHRRTSRWVGLGLMTLYGLFVVGAVMMGMSV